MIKDLDQKKVYKYLDVNESNGIEQATMKQKLKKILVRKKMFDPKIWFKL